MPPAPISATCLPFGRGSGCPDEILLVTRGSECSEASTTLELIVTKLSGKSKGLAGRAGNSVVQPTQSAKVPSGAKREVENTEASTRRCSDPEQGTQRLVATVDVLVLTPSQLPRSPQAPTCISRSSSGLLTEFLGRLRILTPPGDDRDLALLAVTSLPQSSNT